VLAFLGAIALAVLVAVVGYARLKVQFQESADIIRLRHAAYYAALLAEYYERTGTYPFQNDSGPPKWVFIAHEQQLKYTRPGPSYTHDRVAFGEFVRVLEAGLGRPIEERYDPQFAPVNRPNFYTYVWANGRFYFTVHLYGQYPFASRRADDFSGLVITNFIRVGTEGILVDSLLRDSAFLRATKLAPRREAFFIDREEQFLHDSKSRPIPERERVVVQ